jgi:guanosine-3',5'-bis(diphosphate) 3'-pyrophosphohydrolase
MIVPSVPHLVTVYRKIAHKWHNTVKKQVRKYTGLPYTVHTDEVSDIVRQVEPDGYIAQAAAHGHDIYEDVLGHLSPEEFCQQMVQDVTEVIQQEVPFIDPPVGPILRQVVDTINNVILELSDVYTSEAYPQLNRRQRKAKENERFRNVSYWAKTVKFADLISNTSDISKNDPKFARVYLAEKRDLIEALESGKSRGNRVLFKRAKLNV